MLRRGSAVILPGALALLALACGSPAELVVVVDRAEGSPALEFVSVQINDGPAQRSSPGDGEPWTLGVDGRGGQQVRVHVEGRFTTEDDLVVADAVVNLIAGQRRTLHLLLAAPCVNVPCDGTATCDGASAQCVCRERDTCPYAVVGGRIESCPVELDTRCGLDAGPPDSGEPDAGIDGGPDAGPLSDTRFVSLGVGSRHSCGVLENAQVACWGSNDHGELGDDGPPRAFAGRLPPELRATAVASGRFFSCALTQARTVQCWGLGDEGQLARADPTDTALAEIAGLEDVDEIALGDSHACARSGGVVRCWGSNAFDQVTGTVGLSVDSPREFDLGFSALGVAAGGRHTCAWNDAGAIRCWGDDDAGQTLGGALRTLGDAILEVSAGDKHTCALVRADGATQVQCWGDNTFKQTSPLPFDSIAEPHVVALDGATQLEVGADFSCALVGNRRHCWGRNDEGSLAIGTFSSVASTPRLGSGDGLHHMSAGGGFACGLTAERAVCWGWDLAGAVGAGEPIVHPTPVAVSAMPDLDQLALGSDFACGVTADTEGVHCWGVGDRGQLGVGHAVRSRSAAAPAMVTGGAYQSLAAGSAHACVVSVDAQSILCWGDNGVGQAGGIFDALSPTVVEAYVDPDPMLEAGGAHTCVRSDDGTPSVRCWGRGAEGQLGAGGTGPTPRTFEVSAEASDTIVGLHLGGRHTCATVRPDSTTARDTLCWGSNSHFQLGRASQPDSPVVTFGTSQISTRVGAGDTFTCRHSGGGVQCVGNNADGQLGVPASAPQFTPQTVAFGAGPNARIIGAGKSHVCAASSGFTTADPFTVACWGASRHGQLGHSGGAAPTTLALPNADLVGQPLALTVGDRSSCLLTHGGRLFCWGSDEDGRLGLGRQLVYSEPVDVSF